MSKIYSDILISLLKSDGISKNIIQKTIVSKRIKLKYLCDLCGEKDLRIKRYWRYFYFCLMLFVFIYYCLIKYVLELFSVMSEKTNYTLPSLLISIGLGATIPLILYGCSMFASSIGVAQNTKRESEKEIFDICEYLMIHDRMSEQEEMLYKKYSTISEDKFFKWRRK